MAKPGSIESQNGIDSDSLMAAQRQSNQKTLDEWFDRLQSQSDAVGVALKALPPLPGTKKSESTPPTDVKGESMADQKQQEPTLESIRPGASQEELSAAIKRIREVLPGPSTTNMQSAVDAINDANTDPKLREYRAAQQKAEQASAPPPVPDVTGKSEAEKTVIIKQWATNRDAYFQNLMARPTGSPMTRAEGSAMASEILSALRETGHRV